MKKLSKFILNNIKILFLISFSLLSRSLYGQNGGGGAIPPTPEAPMGATNPGTQVPIDMYEGFLLTIAVSMVIGIYYYSKNKKEVYK
jgi:hypothetical protein